MEYVWWWNNQRLHEALDYRTPVEIEIAHYTEKVSPYPTGVTEPKTRTKPKTLQLNFRIHNWKEIQAVFLEGNFRAVLIR